MASKRHIRRKACTGKIRYGSLDAALAAKRRIREGWRLSAYHCSFCGGHHLGHMGRRRQKIIERAREMAR